MSSTLQYRSCSVPDCDVNSKTRPNAKYFRPGNGERAQLWMRRIINERYENENTRRQMLTALMTNKCYATANYNFCENHFLLKDIYSKKDVYMYLHAAAVPVLNIPRYKRVLKPQEKDNKKQEGINDFKCTGTQTVPVDIITLQTSEEATSSCHTFRSVHTQTELTLSEDLNITKKKKTKNKIPKTVYDPKGGKDYAKLRRLQKVKLAEFNNFAKMMRSQLVYKMLQTKPRKVYRPKKAKMDLNQ